MDLERIKLKEKNRRPFKGFFTYTFIQTTASKAQSEMYRVPVDTFEKDFQPSWWRKVWVILVFGFTVFWIIGFSIQQKRDPWSELIIIPLIALMVFIIYDGFFNARKIYRIHLSFEGITMGEEFFQWNNIAQTAILQMGSGRGRKFFLVLTFFDGSYRKFNLQAFQSFWGFQNAVSAYIEYFKKKGLT